LLTEQKILEALKHVEDPEIHKSVVELNMVRNIRVEGEKVSLEVVLTISGCPLKASIEDDVIHSLKAIGAKEVDLTFGTMTDQERAALAERLRQERGESSQSSAKTAKAVPPLLEPGTKTQFIGIASGKGGVGKSTVTVNLAVALSRLGKRVGIIDADIYGFSVPDMMGIEQRPTVIDDVILPVERFGVKVMSMGFFVQNNAPVVWRGPMLGKMLRNFFSEVHWGKLDYILLDLPPGTGDIALDVHQLLPKSKEIVVTTPHATAAFVAARAGAMALQTNHEVLGVIENMSYFACPHCGERTHIYGQGGGERLAKELKTRLLGQLPLGAPDNDPSEPLYAPSVYKEDTEAALIFKKIAEEMVERL